MTWRFNHRKEHGIFPEHILRRRLCLFDHHFPGELPLPALPEPPLLSQSPPPPGSCLRLPSQRAKGCHERASLCRHPLHTTVLVGSGCRNKIPQTGGLPQFWGLEVQDRDANQPSFWGGRYLACRCHLHMVSLCGFFFGACTWKERNLSLSSFSYKAINSVGLRLIPFNII